MIRSGLNRSAKPDQPTVMIQDAYQRMSGSDRSSKRGSKHQRTLHFSDGTTDTLRSDVGSLLVQFGKVLEERHSILQTTPNEIIPDIDSTSGCT